MQRAFPAEVSPHTKILLSNAASNANRISLEIIRYKTVFYMVFSSQGRGTIFSFKEV
jgi:hypothetical protein